VAIILRSPSCMYAPLLRYAMVGLILDIALSALQFICNPGPIMRLSSEFSYVGQDLSMRETFRNDYPHKIIYRRTTVDIVAEYNSNTNLMNTLSLPQPCSLRTPDHFDGLENVDMRLQGLLLRYQFMGRRGIEHRFRPLIPGFYRITTTWACEGQTPPHTMTTQTNLTVWPKGHKLLPAGK
jgi:hypothetical protein